MSTASPAARLLACTALAPCLFAAAPALADEAMDSAAAAPGIVVLGERDEDPPRSATKLPLEVIDTPRGSMSSRSKPTAPITPRAASTSAG